jgi:hypothetical protein
MIITNPLNKNSSRLVLFVALLLFSVASTSALEFSPNCTYSETPDFLPNWNESYDGSNRQDYCEVVIGNETLLHIRQPVFTNRLGEYFTISSPDLWTNSFLLTEQGNVRNVEVQLEYYEPSYNGVCLSQSVNGATGLFNSVQYVLLANHNNGFGQGTTFNDAFLNYNPLMGCDQWNIVSFPVSDMANDFGSSFAGASKTVGSLSFEMKNVYVRDAKIIGTTQTFDLY